MVVFWIFYIADDLRGGRLQTETSLQGFLFPVSRLSPMFRICLIILLSFIGGGCRAPPFLPSRVFAEVQAVWGPNCQDSDLCGQTPHGLIIQVFLLCQIGLQTYFITKGSPCKGLSGQRSINPSFDPTSYIPLPFRDNRLCLRVPQDPLSCRGESRPC